MTTFRAKNYLDLLSGTNYTSPNTGQGNSSSPTRTITKPAGTTDGDLMVLVMWANTGVTNQSGVSASLAFNTPAGWTLLRIDTQGPSTYFPKVSMAVLYKVASSEPASYDVGWTLTDGGHWHLGCDAGYDQAQAQWGLYIAAYSGGDQSIKVEASSIGSYTFAPSGTTGAGETFSTSYANDMLLKFLFFSELSGFISLTEPVNMTSRQADTARFYAEDLLLGAAGTTPVEQYSSSGSGQLMWQYESFCFVNNNTPNTPTMNSSTTTYHTSTPGGTASVTVSCTTTDPNSNSWYGTFSVIAGTGSTVGSGGTSNLTISKASGSYAVTATATNVGGPATSAASASQTITVYDLVGTPTINTALDGKVFDRTIALSATATDASENWRGVWEYQRNGGTWTALGTGSSVAGGVASLLTWNIAGLPFGTYKVRVTGQCTAHGIIGAVQTETGTFLIVHGQGRRANGNSAIKGHRGRGFFSVFLSRLLKVA